MYVLWCHKRLLLQFYPGINFKSNHSIYLLPQGIQPTMLAICNFSVKFVNVYALGMSLVNPLPGIYFAKVNTIKAFITKTIFIYYECKLINHRSSTAILLLLLCWTGRLNSCSCQSRDLFFCASKVLLNYMVKTQVLYAHILDKNPLYSFSFYITLKLFFGNLSLTFTTIHFQEWRLVYTLQRMIWPKNESLWFSNLSMVTRQFNSDI